jgi:hypothetical protein
MDKLELRENRINGLENAAFGYAFLSGGYELLKSFNYDFISLISSDTPWDYKVFWGAAMVAFGTFTSFSALLTADGVYDTIRGTDSYLARYVICGPPKEEVKVLEGQASSA